MPERPTTLGELIAAGYGPKTVKDEVRDNLIAKLKKGENVFPGILGRTCDRPCEPACRRGRVEDENVAKPEPVAICRLKRVAADHKDDISSRLPMDGDLRIRWRIHLGLPDRNVAASTGSAPPGGFDFMLLTVRCAFDRGRRRRDPCVGRRIGNGIAFVRGEHWSDS